MFAGIPVPQTCGINSKHKMKNLCVLCASAVKNIIYFNSDDCVPSIIFSKEHLQFRNHRPYLLPRRGVNIKRGDPVEIGFNQGVVIG